jgi:hypothetical protein
MGTMSVFKMAGNVFGLNNRFNVVLARVISSCGLLN